MLHLVDKIILFFINVMFYLSSSEGKTNLQEIVSVSAVLAFGDSFVDQGNNNYDANSGKANYAPYGKDLVGGIPTGRFSNGKTLPDFFAEGLGVKAYLPAYLNPFLQDDDLLTGVSFASGGSGYDPITDKFMSAIPLSEQLNMFKQYIGKLETKVGEEVANDIITNSVFLVVASTNDLIITLPKIGMQDATQYDNMLANMTISFVQELYNLGARRIAVFSAPPVGCSPAQRTLFGGILRMCAEKLNEAAHLYNTILKQQLPIIASRLPHSRVAFVDFYNPLIHIIDNPKKYGLEVVNRSCCGTGLIEVNYMCIKHSRTCQDDSKFLFWDNIHLSEIGCSIFVNQSLPGLMDSLL
ncbi:hypothetical protein Lser_V15G17016 [Lactuca serriola]